MQLRNISLVLAVALLSPASLVAQKGKPTAEPTRWEVVDGNGTTVGVTTDFVGRDLGGDYPYPYAAAIVLLKGPNGEAAPVEITKNQWLGAGGGVHVYYPTTDCSGQGYIPFLEGSLVAATVGGYNTAGTVSKTTLWVQSGPPATLFFQTYRKNDTCAPIDVPATATHVPVTPTTLMDQFVFPFSLRVR